ncbi:MAG: gas vesicle protein GvpO [Candidatus Heimdallarchaeota archaeon]
MAAGIPELISRAREELSKLTGLELSTVLGATKTEEGWKISIEMIEKYSIPDQMDILAVYDTLLDDDGNLLKFNRRRLRKRVDTEEPEEEEL